jgi:hypothetical protein
LNCMWLALLVSDPVFLMVGIVLAADPVVLACLTLMVRCEQHTVMGYGVGLHGGVMGYTVYCQLS